MAYSGQVLDNPVSGERIVFRKTAADTGAAHYSRSISSSLRTAMSLAFTSTRRRRSASR